MHLWLFFEDKSQALFKNNNYLPPPPNKIKSTFPNLKKEKGRIDAAFLQVYREALQRGTGRVASLQIFSTGGWEFCKLNS